MLLKATGWYQVIGGIAGLLLWYHLPERSSPFLALLFFSASISMGVLLVRNHPAAVFYAFLLQLVQLVFLQGGLHVEFSSGLSLAINYDLSRHTISPYLAFPHATFRISNSYFISQAGLNLSAVLFAGIYWSAYKKRKFPVAALPGIFRVTGMGCLAALLAIASGYLNWINQYFVSGLVFFVLGHLVFNNPVYRKPIYVFLFALPYLLVYCVFTMIYQLYHVFPVWMASLFSLLIAYRYVQRTPAVRWRIAGVYLMILTLTAYIGMPNWLSYVFDPNPFVSAAIKKLPEIRNEKGALYDPAGQKNKVVVIDTWSTTCTVCFEQFPEFEKLYRSYAGDSGVAFATLHLRTAADKDARYKEWIGKYNYTFQKLYASDVRIWDSLEIEAVPTLLIIDKKGRLRFKGPLKTRWYEILYRTSGIIDRLKKES